MYMFKHNILLDFSHLLFLEMLKQCLEHYPDYPTVSLREKCPNTESFLVHFFLYSDWTRRFAEWISIFSPNAGKYGPEITLCLDTFHAVFFSWVKYAFISFPTASGNVPLRLNVDVILTDAVRQSVKYTTLSNSTKIWFGWYSCHEDAILSELPLIPLPMRLLRQSIFPCARSMLLG